MIYSKDVYGTPEGKRMEMAKNHVNPWWRWGPYLSERQWGTVREDYSHDGSAWDFFPHDHAISRCYRWGEDGIAGISDSSQNLCFSLALWNGKDPILKERLFGLNGNQGNHGEDVKEYYFYLANTPSHSYMKHLYKYPQEAYPYAHLVEENAKRLCSHEKGGMEFELLDTNVFKDNRYFDVFTEYAKNEPEDILIRITVANRGPFPEKICVLPTLWFRNTWSWGYENVVKPEMKLHGETATEKVIFASWEEKEEMYLYCENPDDMLFTENQTNMQKIFNQPNEGPYTKDGINDFIVHKSVNSVNPEKKGTKASPVYWLFLKGNETKTIKLRFTKKPLQTPFDLNFEAIINMKESEMNGFYDSIIDPKMSNSLRDIQVQAFAGMLWTKQFYYYDLHTWLKGDPSGPTPPDTRQSGRNCHWRHMYMADIISMPDKWEYPWFAAWDLAFHAVPFAIIDPEFAKRQIHLLTREFYMHPNGQLPAYEWNFADVNPPVSAWAAMKIFNIEKEIYGYADHEFLERMFTKLLLYFTWWVNKKDARGYNIFEGGFLGLDNISVIDRTDPGIKDINLEQTDGTAWIGMFCLNMLRMSIELAKKNATYREWTSKFFQHFLVIAKAMNWEGGLWDTTDEFYYDKIRLKEESVPLKIRSMVGLIPLYVIEIIDFELLKSAPKPSFINFPNPKDERNRRDFFERNEVEFSVLEKMVPDAIEDPEFGDPKGIVLSFIETKDPDYRLRPILKRLLDEDEFLSPYGIRSLSKAHSTPYSVQIQDRSFSIDYQPAESKTNMFGGNSNWRGPVWFPVNFLLIESLYKFYNVYGDSFKMEMPTGSGNMKNLKEIAMDLSERLIKIFEKDEKNNRPVYGGSDVFQKDPHWNNYILFYEYFHGDNGSGIGASHQTGWTGLVAKLIQDKGKFN